MLGESKHRVLAPTHLANVRCHSLMLHAQRTGAPHDLHARGALRKHSREQVQGATLCDVALTSPLPLSMARSMSTSGMSPKVTVTTSTSAALTPVFGLKATTADTVSTLLFACCFIILLA